LIAKRNLAKRYELVKGGSGHNARGWLRLREKEENKETA